MSAAAARAAAGAAEQSSAGRREVLVAKESTFARSDLAFLVHLSALVFYVRTWMWHTTAAAQRLPGSKGFGWFFRYLTFCSYTMQLIQLFLCCVAHVSRHPKQKRRMSAAADVVSCAMFGVANTVTLLFFTVETTTKGAVEGGVDRPPWLNFSVHVLNSLLAWADLLVSEERSFSRRSRQVAVAFALGYSVWIQVVHHYFGKFPYPILNRLPHPWGFMGFFFAGMAIILSVLELGAVVKLRLLGGVRTLGAGTRDKAT